MTEQQWHKATEEEKQAEYVRCQDPWYYYSNYFVTADGKKPPPITKERFDEIVTNIETVRYLRFKRLGYGQ